MIYTFYRYFNDTEIKSTQKTRVDTKGPVSTLTINKADMPDVGVYKVVADNGKERIETQANVDVCGRSFGHRSTCTLTNSCLQ